MCLVCGQDNHAGLHTQFLECDDGTLLAYFTPDEQHQSYPGRTHGGVEAALLDELIGRTIQVEEPETWGVTMELRVKYRKPLPYGQGLWARARLTENRNRLMEGTGEILLPDGQVAAEAWARYMKLPISKIVDDGEHLLSEMRPDTRELPPTVTLPD